jgi:hypothetical protein
LLNLWGNLESDESSLFDKGRDEELSKNIVDHNHLKDIMTDV